MWCRVSREFCERGFLLTCIRDAEIISRSFHIESVMHESSCTVTYSQMESRSPAITECDGQAGFMSSLQEKLSLIREFHFLSCVVGLSTLCPFLFFAFPRQSTRKEKSSSLFLPITAIHKNEERMRLPLNRQAQRDTDATWVSHSNNSYTTSSSCMSVRFSVSIWISHVT